MGRQHPGMDGLDTGCRHEESGETRGVEGAGCQDICGAPTVHRDYGIGKARRAVCYSSASSWCSYVLPW